MVDLLPNQKVEADCNNLNQVGDWESGGEARGDTQLEVLTLQFRVYHTMMSQGYSNVAPRL
jgi:hypothetical protein